jgi:hypothetical protein
VTLYSESLRVRIATISSGANSLFGCHLYAYLISVMRTLVKS